MKKVFFLILLAVLLSCPLSAQDKIQTLVNYYDSEIMTISYQSFGGINLGFHGQASSTAMGIQPAFSSALLQYEDSGDSYNSYRILNTTGNISYALGFSAILFGAYFPYFANYDIQSFDGFLNNYLDNYKISLGFIIGGTVCTIIYAITKPLAQENLFQGVNQYNRHKIEEYEK